MQNDSFAFAFKISFQLYTTYDKPVQSPTHTADFCRNHLQFSYKHAWVM